MSNQIVPDVSNKDKQECIIYMDNLRKDILRDAKMTVEMKAINYAAHKQNFCRPDRQLVSTGKEFLKSAKQRHSLNDDELLFKVLYSDVC